MCCQSVACYVSDSSTPRPNNVIEWVQAHSLESGGMHHFGTNSVVRE
jgi:hypothetical protein